MSGLQVVWFSGMAEGEKRQLVLSMFIDNHLSKLPGPLNVSGFHSCHKVMKLLMKTEFTHHHSSANSI